jgi:hypothetical protein
MMRHINDEAAEYFFCKIVRSDEGRRGRKTLLYNETIAVVSDLFDSGSAY